MQSVAKRESATRSSVLRIMSDEWSSIARHGKVSRGLLIASAVAVAILLFQVVLLLFVSPSDDESLNIADIGGSVSWPRSPPTPDNPVILLGLPRSGSIAIHNYFECHGWTSAHYCCGKTRAATQFPCLEGSAPTCGGCVLRNLQNHRPAFESCGPAQVQVWSQFDVETSTAWFLPQHFALGLLHEAYPNATWILNTRGSAREWAESIFHWHSMTRRFFTSFHLESEPRHALTIPPPRPADNVSAAELKLDMQRQLESRVYNETESMRKLALLQHLYENHTRAIYQWARQLSSHPFLHLNVDSDGSLSTLDKKFGFKSAGKCKWTFQSPTNDWKNFNLPFEGL